MRLAHGVILLDRLWEFCDGCTFFVGRQVLMSRGVAVFVFKVRDSPPPPPPPDRRCFCLGSTVGSSLLLRSCPPAGGGWGGGLSGVGRAGVLFSLEGISVMAVVFPLVVRSLLGVGSWVEFSWRMLVICSSLLTLM